MEKLLASFLLILAMASAQQTTGDGSVGETRSGSRNVKTEDLMFQMFQRFSQRTRHVVFVARLKAGQRGASAISVDDLILGLLIEDQDKVVEAVSQVENSGTPQNSDAPRMVTTPHPPFFDAQTAKDLLTKVERLMVRSAPVPSTVDMPVSAELERAFTVATGLADKLHQKQVQPLHLLSAAVEDGSSKGAELLRQSGVTHDKVFQALRQQP